MESVTAGRSDPRVDQYIDALPEWQRDVARQVRRLVHEADPDVAEVIKRVRQPYFVLHGNICALLDLLRAVIANNRAGGWRKIKARG